MDPPDPAVALMVKSAARTGVSSRRRASAIERNVTGDGIRSVMEVVFGDYLEPGRITSRRAPDVPLESSIKSPSCT